MKLSFHVPTVFLSGLAFVLISSTTFAQIVINEIVYDERNAFSSEIPDTREFIELYNAGGSAVDIGNWSIETVLLDDGSPFTSNAIPASTMLAAGDYYVIGQTGVSNLDLDLGSAPLWPDDNVVYELRDDSATLVDALGVEIAGDPQLLNASAGQLAQIGTGVWGPTLSANTTFSQSLSRYVDGRDTNVNGYDFGNIPFTPGTSNNLSQIGDFTPPDVDGLSTGSTVAGFGGSFVLPKVIDPTVADSNNPNAISASPQGGKAIVAWDGSGGGNFNNTNSLVTSFDLYAYIETQALGVSAGTGDVEWESTIYGIGTSDPFFSNPDPNGVLDPSQSFGTTNNGSTGVGWLYQRVEDDLIGLEVAQLLLVDFNDGGDSLPSGADWTVIQAFDMGSEASDWHRLGIDFDPNTGDVTARLDDQTFNFTTSTDLIGTFYTGYREALSPSPVPSSARPATFDLFDAAQDDADFDNDNDVDGADFLIWQQNLGTGTMQSQGDADGDGDVDGDDLGIWEGQYGVVPLSAVSAAVPEPSSFLLLVLGGLATLRRQR